MRKPKIDFARSVAEERGPAEDRSPIDPDRQFSGQSPLDRRTDVDPEAESAEWERRYGTEESRQKLGFDGGDRSNDEP